MNLRALNEFLDSQDHYWPDGRMNAVYPNGDGKRDIPDYTQFFLFWAWDYYLQTGDKEWLLKNYSKLKKNSRLCFKT
jgi:alpha-L-rhamnosidase